MGTLIRSERINNLPEEDLEISINAFVDHSVVQIRSMRVRGTLIVPSDCGQEELTELADMISDSLVNSSMENNFMVDETEKGC